MSFDVGRAAQVRGPSSGQTTLAGGRRARRWGGRGGVGGGGAGGGGEGGGGGEMVMRAPGTGVFPRGVCWWGPPRPPGPPRRYRKIRRSPSHRYALPRCYRAAIQ